jgi:hypothetical protein
LGGKKAMEVERIGVVSWLFGDHSVLKRKRGIKRVVIGLFNGVKYRERLWWWLDGLIDELLL